MCIRDRTTAAEEPSEESADAADPSSDDGNTDDQTETETMGETDVTTAADSEDASDQAGSGDVRAAFPVKIVLIIVGILAAAALIGGGIWFRIQSNKKEAEAEALRREKRRQDVYKRQKWDSTRSLTIPWRRRSRPRNRWSGENTASENP